MYSGNKTIDYPTQWALNPSAYQDMTNDQVDWAALAQQWIQMKESCPTVAIPPAPPPPIISTPVLEEEGEAPMDVEGNEIDAAPPAPIVSSQQWKNSTNNSNWSNSWDQWGEGNNQENWNWQSNSSSKAPQPPLAPPPYSTGYTSTDANFSGYNNNGPQNYRTGYWSTDAENKPNNIPNQMNEIGNRVLRRIPRQQNAPEPAPSPQIANSVDTTQTIDAAKRRQLPAWIREGLEKMEREKQKQMDRERELKEREELLKQQELDAVQPPTQEDGVPQVPAKSKFESDSNDSEPEVEVKKPQKVPAREQIALIPLLPKTQEEIMQEVMLCVRRTLTEILLDVTNEQILEVCQEELNRKRSQPQASRGTSVASKSQALSSIGGQLGLGIYGDSSGESDTDADSGEEEGRRSSTPVGKHRKRAELTDAQLQESIRRKMADFEKTAREIENQIASDDAAHKKNDSGDVSNRTGAAEERSSRHGEGLGNSDSDGEESTTHNRNEVNSNRQRKFSSDKTPPADNAKKSFSDKSEKYLHYSKSNSETKSRHGETSNSKRESSNKRDASKRKRNGSKKSDRRSGNSKRRSRSLSANSNSERSDDSEKESYSRSPSSSSNTESSYSGSSHSSRSRRKRSRKSKKNSEERSTARKKDKGRSKRNRKDDEVESDSENKNARDSVSSNRRSRTPDRRYKRSHSRSEDRHGHYYDKKHYSSNRYKSREQDRSRDRKNDYRDKRDRGSDRYNRDRRDTSKENRGSSKDKYDRDRRSDRRDYKDSSRRSRY